MNQKSTKLILFLTVFLNFAGFTIILPLVPATMNFYIGQDLSHSSLLVAFIKAASGLSKQFAQGDSLFSTTVFFGCLLSSVYALLQFVFAPLWGKLSDRIGRRPTLLFTLFFTFISYMVWAFSTHFDWFIFSRILAGTMAGNIAVANAAMADITDRSQRTQGMALIGAAFALGFIIGPALGGLTSQLDLRTYSDLFIPFSGCAFVAGFLALINFIWVFFKLPETNTQRKARFKDENTEGVILSNGILKTNTINFIYTFIFSGLEFTLSFLSVERFSYTPSDVGMLFVYIGVVLTVVQGYLVRKLSTQFTEAQLTGTGIIFGVISFAVLGYTQQVNGLYLGSGLLALSIGLVSPSLTGLVSLYADEAQQGKYLGIFRSCGSLARALGPLGVAILYIVIGSQYTYWIASAFFLLPLVIVMMLPKPMKA